jgi:uncharacterized protein YbaP (TraB family)
MVGILVAAAIAGATPVAPPAPTMAAPEAATNADPAIFVVRDADTTVYLFGTFHALDGKAEWFNDQVRDAFESSDELVLETLVPERPSVMPVKAAAPAPQQFKIVVPSASFLASTRMAINAGKSQGMQVGNGADMVLRRTAEAEGKPVEGLETLQSQLAMFAKMPATAPAPAAAAQRASAPAMRNLSQSMAEMQDAWKRGDQAVFVRVLSQLEQGSPDTYRMMFTERNARWADWIRARMQTPGTVFVAVGAGHLAGKDSVLVQLAERGIYSTRVN